jgi:hypothetical protein
MTYKKFLSKCKIKPRLTYEIRAHKFVFDTLKQGLTNQNLKAIKRILMSLWAKWSSLAKKYHKDLVSWIIEDCTKAMGLNT